MSHFRYVTLRGVSCQKCVLGRPFSLNYVPLNFPKSRNWSGLWCLQVLVVPSGFLPGSYSAFRRLQAPIQALVVPSGSHSVSRGAFRLPFRPLWCLQAPIQSLVVPSGSHSVSGGAFGLSW